jgi:hypothetical protein
MLPNVCPAKYHNPEMQNTIGGESESANAMQICKFFVPHSGLAGLSVSTVPTGGAD